MSGDAGQPARRLPRFALPLALGGFALDQATKVWVRATLELHDGFPVLPGFFNLVHVGNTGAAFGMFKGGNAGFIALSAVAAIALGFMAWRGFFARPLAATAGALLLAGIAGNLLDRILIGHVTDFLDFYWGSYHWPAFNVADSCICVAAALLVLAEFLGEKPGSRSPGAGG